MPIPKLNLQSLPTRNFLDKTVTPTLLDGLKTLAKERQNINNFKNKKKYFNNKAT